MGGLFGGTPQTQSSQTNSVPTLPAYLQPYETQAASAAQSLYNSGQLAPSYYPGQTVAPLSTQTQGGINATTSLANGGQPSALQSAATQSQLGIINGNQMFAESNPYLQSAMNAANYGTTQQFANSILPGIQSSFSKAGRSSSDAYGNTIGQAAGQLGATLANSNANLAYQNYNDAANRQQSAIQNAPTLAAGDYANAQKLLQAGSLVDNQNQALTDADIQKYNYNANLPQNSLQNYINLLNGTAGAVGNASTTNTQAFGDQSRTASTIGTALTLASLFSDRRLKKNIEKVGKYKGYNWYKYNYIWGGEPFFGVMADEVMEKNPKAVHMDDSGYLKVNYGLL